MYTPPFTISANAINLISDISAKLERFAIRMEQKDGIKLRKVNRMKTIRGSLAIEGNSLSEEQVTAIIEGKHVLAPMQEVLEVRNAVKAYDSFMTFNPYDYKDLLKAHGIMAMGLVDNPGHFRKGGVCVAGKDGVSHIAPPADRLPFLFVSNCCETYSLNLESGNVASEILTMSEAEEDLIEEPKPHPPASKAQHRKAAVFFLFIIKTLFS